VRLYNSFLLRCWLIRSAPEGERSVLDIEHIQTGEHFRPATLVEAEGWMCDALHRAEQGALDGAAAAPRGADD
jgi:hypothetical protein